MTTLAQKTFYLHRRLEAQSLAPSRAAAADKISEMAASVAQTPSDPQWPQKAQVSQIRSASMIPASWTDSRVVAHAVQTTRPQDRQFVMASHRCFLLRPVICHSKTL